MVIFCYGAGNLCLLPFLIHNSPSSLSCEITKISCSPTSEKKQQPRSVSSISEGPGAFCMLITRCWTSPLLQGESGTAVSIHWYLVFQWSRRQLKLVRNFLSLATTKEVLMPGDGTGSDRISPMTLYGVFLKNKVNKTWDAEPWILIICLWLWGGGRRGVEARGARAADMKRESEWERRNQRGREGGCFDAFGMHRHQCDAGAWGGSTLLFSVMIVGEAERRRAGTNQSNVQEVLNTAF